MIIFAYYYVMGNTFSITESDKTFLTFFREEKKLKA